MNTLKKVHRGVEDTMLDIPNENKERFKRHVGVIKRYNMVKKTQRIIKDLDFRDIPKASKDGRFITTVIRVFNLEFISRLAMKGTLKFIPLSSIKKQP